MNDQEAAKLVVTMQAAWPGFAEDDGANRMWATVIARSDAKVGAQACRSLIGHLKHKPTIADWNESVREAYRHIEPGQARKELGYDPGPMDPNTAKRVNDEFKLAMAERKHRFETMNADEFILSEGHDPRTHRLSQSGYVLRRIDPGTKQPVR